MLLDDLVNAIQTVQARIREHGNSLSQNEYRTRISLIDPVLNALGWDVSDPRLVTIEDQYSGGRPDYALLGKDGSKSLAFVEAKRLGAPLDAHQDQVFKYTWDRKVFYAGLTDGNRWVFRDVTAEFSQPPREGLLLDMTISRETAHKCALRLLLLWRQTLADGEPIEASEPVLVSPSENLPSIEKSVGSSATESPPSGWVSLVDYRYSDATNPPKIRLPDNREFELEHWYGILVETAEWLVRSGVLTAATCPISNKAGGVLVNTEPKETSGKPIGIYHKLSNGLILKTHGNLFTLLSGAKILLGSFGKDPASILLKHI